MRNKIPDEIRRALCHEATLVARYAYAPYSNFHVGAAVLGSSGTIYRGANIENASYGLSICAERVALANAKVNNEAEITAIAVACVDIKSDDFLERKVPCGACRQWIHELAPGAEIFIVGKKESYLISDLLPSAFNLDR